MRRNGSRYKGSRYNSYSAEANDRIEETLQFRVTQIEHVVDDLKTFSDELRVGQQARTEQIAYLKQCEERHDKDIADIRDKQLDQFAAVAKRIDDMATTFNMKIDEVANTLSGKFEENKNWNSRWFVGILAGLVTLFLTLLLTGKL